MGVLATMDVMASIAEMMTRARYHEPELPVKPFSEKPVKIPGSG
jgi:hypothetical protein